MTGCAFPIVKWQIFHGYSERKQVKQYIKQNIQKGERNRTTGATIFDYHFKFYWDWVWGGTNKLRRVWRYQRGNQNPYIAEEQTTQWPKESVQKDKQRSTKHTHKTEDKVTRTPLKSLVYIVVVTTMCILFFEIHVRILTRANSVALTTYGAHYGPQLGFPYNNPTSRHYPHRRDILAPTTWRRAGSSLWRAMWTTTSAHQI